MLIWFFYYNFYFFTVKEHYTGNKVRNAQVREDLPRAKVEQELEALRYQTYVQQQLVMLLVYLMMHNSLIWQAIVFLNTFFFPLKRRERRTCRQTNRTFFRARWKTERARAARVDEITTKTWWWSYTAGDWETCTRRKRWGMLQSIYVAFHSSHINY